MTRLVKLDVRKSPSEVISKIRKNASEFDFIVRYVFDMKEQFRSHDVDVDNDFEYYSIMVCNPEKAYRSITKNPLRGAVLLPPKQIVIYADKVAGKTVIAYMKMNKSSIKEILPEDTAFQESLEQSCEKIGKLIESLKD